MQQLAVSRALGEEGAHRLQQADEHQQNNHAYVHDILMLLVLAIVDGKAYFEVIGQDYR